MSRTILSQSTNRNRPALHQTYCTMSKRPAEEPSSGRTALKGGERPNRHEDGDEVGDFEDEFEDEYESEEEIFEAGVDGRPDAEREADERRGM